MVSMELNLPVDRVLIWCFEVTIPDDGTYEDALAFHHYRLSLAICCVCDNWELGENRVCASNSRASKIFPTHHMADRCPAQQPARTKEG
ncbi:hypothetical protein AOLI_G00169350 [Acnodon oligacanthus]